MSRTLLPLEGRPEGLRGLADVLSGGATRLAAINTVLLGLRAGARWDSPSGHAFESAVQAPPPVIAAVIERYAGAARSLRTFADELEEAQHTVGEALASHREAWRRHDTFMERRGVAVDSVEQQDLERAMNAEVAVIAEAERRHAVAAMRQTEADRACARTLRALARDALDDPTAYSALVAGGAASRPAALVGGVLPGRFRLVGAAGAAVGTLTQVGLLVLYDEGSWKEVGTNVLGAAVTALGSVLVAGSAVGARAVATGGRRVFGKTANPTMGFRLGAGARTTFDDWVDGWRTKVGLAVRPRPSPVVPRPLPPATSVAGKARNATLRAVDGAFLDSWRMASASGPQAQRMFVAGVTIQQAPTVAKQVSNTLERRVERQEQAARREREATEVPVELRAR
ncbi:hypothetical protein LL946_18835 [Knoellia locipacati]|uniref:hypothetical protein n=1 Tax=Knoellia locipacati TaxID=882824 RepID=UPI00384E2605